jgi:hypothetical protein
MQKKKGEKVKVRGTEFSEASVKLFIEKFIEQLGDNDPYYSKKLMDDIAFGGKEISNEDAFLEIQRKMKKENKELSDECEYYVNKVIEYEHTLSKFRLDELIDEDVYVEGWEIGDGQHDDGGNEDEDENVPLTAWEAGPTGMIGVDSERVRTDESHLPEGWHRGVYGTNITQDRAVGLATGS